VRGRFIVLEGGEGAGKSRLAEALRERLEAAGEQVVVTREPGGTALGEELRDVLLRHQGLDDPLAELLLFEAARAHLVATVIAPALDAGKTVICDRYTASSVAYQSSGCGLPREEVDLANAIATRGLEPDLTLLLDVPVDIGLRRRTGDGAPNHFDAASREFHERVHAGYAALAREHAERWRVIDATQPFAVVVEDALRAIGEVRPLPR